MFNYIGETCRYLLSQPPTRHDRAHRIRLGIGNGLRKEIWQEFMTRFNIPVIGECYASTEGNANMINIDNRIGAVGFNSVIAPGFYPIGLIHIDRTTGEILRDSNNMAIPCRPGEFGELVGKVRCKYTLFMQSEAIWFHLGRVSGLDAWYLWFPIHPSCTLDM